MMSINQDQARLLTRAIQYGFKQLESLRNIGNEEFFDQTTDLAMVELAHSMNRKGLLLNDEVEQFVKMLKEEPTP